MSTQTGNVWSTLQQAGLVQGSAPESNQQDSPWYIKLLLAISGWLAALFLLGFLGAGFDFVFRNAATSLIVGSIMICAAFALLRVPKNDFVEHIALAVSLAGQALLIWVIFDSTNSTTSWLVTAILQLGLAAVMPNFVHRVISSFVSAFCFSAGLAASGVPYIAGSIVMFTAAWLWLHEFNYPEHMRKQKAIGYGLVLGLIQIKGSALFGLSTLGWRAAEADLMLWVQPWMGEVLTGAVTLYVVWTILKRLGHALSDPITIVALSGTVLLTIVSMEARGITVGMLILLLGFAVSNRVLMGLGIISLLFYISSYYYLLNTTLLAKSQTLLIVGLVLLAARWLLLRIAPTHKEADHV